MKKTLFALLLFTASCLPQQSTPAAVPIPPATRIVAPQPQAALVELPAPAVRVTVSGPVSRTSATIYFDRYVAQSMDYGFIWLDTVSYIGGYVGVAGKCNLPSASPDTGLYFIGDCNGTGRIIYDRSRNQLVAGLGIGGNCGVSWCPRAPSGTPEATQFPWPVAFTPGAWTYLGHAPCASDPLSCQDGGQAADLQGRTWTLATLSSTSFEWSVNGSGQAPQVTPSPTTTPVVTVVLVPNPTPPFPPCSDAGFPYGKPGSFGLCQSCDGTFLGPQPCGPTVVGTPSPTPTPTPQITSAPPCAGATDVERYLLLGRFRVTARWSLPDGRNGLADFADLSHNTGPAHRLFSFFAIDNFELGVKIGLIGQHYVVFYAGFTNVQWTLTVTDKVTGTTRTYSSTYGSSTAGYDAVSF